MTPSPSLSPKICVSKILIIPSPSKSLSDTPTWAPFKLLKTGDVLLLVVPSPSWPSLFDPQHWIDRLSNNVHVWEFPDATAIAVRGVVMLTKTGTFLNVVVPSPSWPYEFSPQHISSESLSTTQLWLDPLEIDTAASPEPKFVTTGVLLLVQVPSPNCPWPL